MILTVTMLHFPIRNCYTLFRCHNVSLYSGESAVIAASFLYETDTDVLKAMEPCKATCFRN